MSDAERKRLRWIPVTERLPDIERPKSDGVECIVMCSTGLVTAMRYTENRYAKTEKGRRPRWEWNWRITTWEVTHWMSLSDVIAAASAPAPSEDDAQQPRDGEEVKRG